MAEENKDLQTAEETSALPDAPEEAEKKRQETVESWLCCWAQAIVTAVVSVVLLFTFGVRLISVSGPSMQNTLYTGDRLLILNAMFCDFKAGDVVVVNDYNAELDDTLVKRIVAVGGQTVDIDFLSGTDSRDTRLGPVKEGYLQGKALLLLTPGVTPDTGRTEWGRVGLVR